MSPRPTITPFVCVALFAVGMLTACTTKSEARVEVTGTNNACTANADTLNAGKITFEFTNEASDTSELYLLRADGSVASEVENVSSGTTRDLTADLSAGTYTLTCKPGQAGDGLSTTIEVSGKGGAAVATGAAGNDVKVLAKDYSFSLDETVEFAAGTTYTFALTNTGTLDHEMEVFGPDGTALGEVGPTKVGATGKVTLEFDQPGVYRLVCGIEGHEALGMSTDLAVR